MDGSVQRIGVGDNACTVAYRIRKHVRRFGLREANTAERASERASVSHGGVGQIGTRNLLFHLLPFDVRSPWLHPRHALSAERGEITPDRTLTLQKSTLRAYTPTHTNTNTLRRPINPCSPGTNPTLKTYNTADARLVSASNGSSSVIKRHFDGRSSNEESSFYRCCINRYILYVLNGLNRRVNREIMRKILQKYCFHRFSVDRVYIGAYSRKVGGEFVSLVVFRMADFMEESEHCFDRRWRRREGICRCIVSELAVDTVEHRFSVFDLNCLVPLDATRAGLYTWERFAPQTFPALKYESNYVYEYLINKLVTRFANVHRAKVSALDTILQIMYLIYLSDSLAHVLFISPCETRTRGFDLESPEQRVNGYPVLVEGDKDKRKRKRKR